MSTAFLLLVAVWGLVLISGGVLLILLKQFSRQRTQADKALKEIERIQKSGTPMRFEDSLALIGKLPASKYSDELHDKLFAKVDRAERVIHAPEPSDPLAHLFVEEGTPRKALIPTEQGQVVLTDRQRRILQVLVEEGGPMTTAQIAQRLGVNRADARMQLSDLISRLSVIPR